MDHGWHTGLVLARNDIAPGLWPEHDDLPRTRFLEIGWGDRAFYQAERVTSGLALQAVFRSTGSVLHLAGFDRPVAEAFPGAEIIAVDLSEQGFAELTRFIHESYARDNTGKPIRLGPGLYATSRFYVATGDYHLFNNCNQWTARALRSAGCPITPGRAITAGSVIRQARAFGRPAGTSVR